MSNITVSINPFAEYLEATDNRRLSILHEQLEPDPVRIPWYQLAKARIAKSVLENGNNSVTDEALSVLAGRNPIKKWQKIDRINSIDALSRWKKMVLPDKIRSNELEVVRTQHKFFPFHGINIRVSPNLIFRTEVNGQKVLGAIKIHVSKSKPFSREQSALVAQIVNMFVSNFVANEDEIVDPQLCLCIDPFAGTTISAWNKVNLDMKKVKRICEEIPDLWDQAYANSKTGTED